MFDSSLGLFSHNQESSRLTAAVLAVVGRKLVNSYNTFFNDWSGKFMPSGVLLLEWHNV